MPPPWPGATWRSSGPCPPILVQVIEGRARARGVADRVEVTGAVDEAAWRGWLDRATLAVQLREPASGETSAAVLEALAAGVPVVTNLATAAEYGEGTVDLLASADAAVVGARLRTLLDRPQDRAELSEAGMAFARAHRIRWPGRDPAVGGHRSMKLGVVVPRYGEDVVGGTEHWLRLLCEHLVAMKQWPVEVFTTCATSAATWADETPPGDSEIGGVTVHRHRSRRGRDPRYAELGVVIRADPTRVPDDVARRYVDLVGPVCPDVLDHAASSDCDLIALTPYLFWPAVYGAPRLGRRVIFHGAAHDEPELHLPIIREVFGSVGGFAFNSYAERALVERTFPIAHLPASVIGNSVAEGPGDPASARAALGLAAGEPFVLCLGRVERDKGSHALAELWRRYRRRRPGAPRLVMLGPVHEELVADSDVLVAGGRSEDVKWGALARLRVPHRTLGAGIVQSGGPRELARRTAGARERVVRGHGGTLPAKRRRALVRRRRGVRRRRRPPAVGPGPAGSPGPTRRCVHPPAVQLARRRGSLRRSGRTYPGRGAVAPTRGRRDRPHYDLSMRHPYLSRAAARMRDALGLDDLARRLDAIESRLAGVTTDRYPNPPVYFGDHTALVATRWGAKMLVDTRDAMVAPWLVLDGLWESTVTEWLQRTLRPGQVFVDVGANIGYFTLLGATLVGPEGTCVGIEAHPRLAELLQRNVIINGLHGYVTTWQLAAWSETTELKLHVRRNFASNSSVASIGPDALKRLGDTEKVVEVHAVRLDDLLDDLPRVDVMKVDTEGAEVQVFAGLTGIMASNPAITIVFEWSPSQIEDVGDDPGALLDLLGSQGFSFRLIEGGLSTIDRARLIDLPYGNVVATR